MRAQENLRRPHGFRIGILERIQIRRIVAPVAHLAQRRETMAVTLEDIQRVAKKYFAEPPMLTAIVQPAGE